MKILVANLGSTSLKWRLFDFANGGERLPHKGGFERGLDYPKAIEECLAQLKSSGSITTESDLAAVGFKTVIAKGISGCVRLDEGVVRAMEAYNGLAPAHNPPYISGIRLFARRIPEAAPPCRPPGRGRGAGAGFFPAPATCSSPNAPPSCLAAKMWPNAPAA